MTRRLVVREQSGCMENSTRALAEAGAPPFRIANPVNFFQQSPVPPDGRLVPGTAASKAGDNVELRAEMGLLFVVTACSQDVARINGERCTSVHLEVGKLSR